MVKFWSQSISRDGPSSFDSAYEFVNAFISARIHTRKGTADLFNDWQLASAMKIASILYAGGISKPPEYFYSLAIDSVGPSLWIADFEEWEKRRATRRFSFCQYPFIMSLGMKLAIMKFETDRRAKYTSAAPVHLRIRRKFLLQDALQQVRMVNINATKDLQSGMLDRKQPRKHEVEAGGEFCRGR